MISCIIVEDEPLAMERTKSYVQKLPYLQLLAAFDNAMDALLYLKANAVQLIFLDINMGDFSGIQLLETKNIQSEVIILTAHHEYAIKSYELNVTDYLLKPYTFERFIQAVEKVQQQLNRPAAVADNKFMFIKTAFKLEKIFLNDVLYIEGMRDYRKIITLDKPIMTLQTFKDFELEISPRIICRVHKSYMVALNKIESVEKDLIKINNQLIPISDSYKKLFFEQILPLS
jgi:DNA-binding LytR/AlgR family response regulator